jgi:hypothetical protein
LIINTGFRKQGPGRGLKYNMLEFLDADRIDRGL